MVRSAFAATAFFLIASTGVNASAQYDRFMQENRVPDLPNSRNYTNFNGFSFGVQGVGPTGGNQLLDGGAGWTLGREGPPIVQFGAWDVSWVTNLDLSYLNPNRQSQLNKLGQIVGGDREVDGAFFGALRPRLRCRSDIPRLFMSRDGAGCNFLCDAGLYLGYHSGGSHIVDFDPSLAQVPIDTITHKDWPVGFSVGAGLERVSRNGQAFRVMFNLSQFNTNLFTGINRGETTIGVSVVMDVPYKMFVTPRIIIQEEEEEK